jgi:hypothetical protein
MRECNKVATHTAGSLTGSPLTNAGSGNYITGTVVPIDGSTTTNTLKKGDVITFDTVYACNPITKQSTGFLREFVVTADFTASGGAGNVSISPAIIPSGAFQNICAADSTALAGVPDNKAVVTKTQASAGTASVANQHMAWWRKAIGLVTVPIAPLDGAVKSVTRTYDGISLTFTSGADIMNFKTIKRVDLAFGVDIFQPYQDQVVRITG